MKMIVLLTIVIFATGCSLLGFQASRKPASTNYWTVGEGPGSSKFWIDGEGPGSNQYWLHGNRCGSKKYWFSGKGPGSKKFWDTGKGPGSKEYWLYGDGPGSTFYFLHRSGPSNVRVSQSVFLWCPKWEAPQKKGTPAPAAEASSSAGAAPSTTGP